MGVGATGERGHLKERRSGSGEGAESHSIPLSALPSLTSRLWLSPSVL